MMKKLSIIILLLSCTISTFAQERMTIHLKDGSQVSYDMDKVDYVEMEQQAVSRDTIQNIGGTIAEAVDMGLSVKWATHNVGATSLSEAGGKYSWGEGQSCANLWGDGWRLPTEEEWKELYETCSWHWDVVDGIGGRIIKGKNGNTIFIPASGINLDGSAQVVGNLGVYWTSASSATEAVNAVGTYFDSANIYRIEFSKTSTFTVRLVKE